MENVLTGGILLLFFIAGAISGSIIIARRYLRLEIRNDVGFTSDPSVLTWLNVQLNLLVSGKWHLSQLQQDDQDQVENQSALSSSLSEYFIEDPVEGSKNQASQFRSNFKKLSVVLFVLSLALYLIIRLIGLEKFPIFFFTDEAVHMILAEELVQNHFLRDGKFLPIYFPLGSSFGLNSISVYLNVIPYLLFGKSVFVTRAITVIVSLGGALAIAGILKDFFHSKYWWTSVLLLSLTPSWFYHSRTAFEYLLGAAFFAIFLYFYLCYRLRSPKYLFLAILFGAMVFYSHGLGQPLIGVTTLLLILIDHRYHWQNRRTVIVGLGLVLILLWPYYRFSRDNPAVFEEQIRTRGSYWLDQTLMFSDKISKFAQEYLTGFSPFFWYMPENGRDLARHMMKGFGHLPLVGLPFFIYGFWQAARQIRNPASQVVMVALIASPFGAALAQVTILRVIWLVIPVAILTGLGLSHLLEKLKISQTAVAIGVFALLCAGNVYLFRESLIKGPLWFRDYSLYGMQYGASQLFGAAIPDMMDQDPQSHFVVSPNWANGTDHFPNFFLTPEQRKRVRLDSINAFLNERMPVDDNLILVLPKTEYDEAVMSPKFQEVRTLDVIPYPDGSPGFYFIQIEYADNADEIFETERLARSQPMDGQVFIDGQPANIVYSRIDMGQPDAIFDGDINTLMRGLEANPFVIDIIFDDPIIANGMSADFANMDFNLQAELYENLAGDPVIYEAEYRGLPGNPHIELMFDRGPVSISRLRIEIFSLTGEQPPHIHVRELQFLP